MTLSKSFLSTSVLALGLAFGGPSVALDDPTRAPYYEAFKGAKVAYLPISMGANITAGWAAGLKGALEPLGVEFMIRDGNFSIDATAQAITNLIDQKVDVLVVQNVDIQALAKLYKKARKEGVYVVQIGMQSVVQTDGFVGPDWTELGEKMADAAIAQCGAGSGKSGKIALVQGAVTSANGIFVTQAIEAAFSDHPEMNIVVNQGSDWDPSKAKAIAETALQQHPDLCGFLGYWEDEDQGIVAALKEADKEDEVFLLTSGIGEEKSCEQVVNGEFDAYLSYDSRVVAQQAFDVISTLLQTRPKAGSQKVIKFTQLRELTKENVDEDACWSVDSLIGDTFK